jgi:CMP-N,N'-diacetyllegionaminic acid synthase
MHVVALLTGRGNNTLHDKNILPVLGKPLLAYTAMAARASKYITSFFASSDCPKILDAAAAYGYLPIRRPGHLSLPTAQHKDAIVHAVEVLKGIYGISPDILVVQLANVATVKPEWFDACIKIMMDDPQVSAVVPAHQDNDHHPYRAKKVGKDGCLEPFFDFSNMKVSTNRQDLEPSYFLDHSFWVLNMKCSLFAGSGQKPWDFMGNRIKLFETHGTFDVHDRDDLDKTAEWLTTNGIVQRM